MTKKGCSGVVALHHAGDVERTHAVAAEEVRPQTSENKLGRRVPPVLPHHFENRPFIEQPGNVLGLYSNIVRSVAEQVAGAASGGREEL